MMLPPITWALYPTECGENSTPSSGPRNSSGLIWSASSQSTMIQRLCQELVDRGEKCVRLQCVEGNMRMACMLVQ
jgi:hypothetical protein